MIETHMFIIVVLTYLAVVIGIGVWRSRGVKSQEDFMVAGRSVPAWLLVGTLVCTWIGAGSLLGGGGRAFREGFSQLWMSGGAWLAIIIIFFLADRVRRISQYTVQDLLERRYHPAARVLGAIVVILGSTTIFSYQLRGGAFVLEYMLMWPQQWGVLITAVVIILLTIFAGLRSIVAIDVVNGVLIILAIIIGLPLMLAIVGGGDIGSGVQHVTETLPPEHFSLFGTQDQTEGGGTDPVLGLIWAMGVFFPTFFLLLGESSIYQKFYSAKDERSARQAVIGFFIGVVLIEIALAAFAVVSSSHDDADAWRRGLAAYEQAEETALTPEQKRENWNTFVAAIQPEGIEVPQRPEGDAEALAAAARLYRTRTDSINLFSAFRLLPFWAGALLLAGGMAIILSTGNSFMMAASTALTRDIWQRFLRPRAKQREIIWVQRATMIVLAAAAVSMLTVFTTVWQMALAAYTVIGAGLTPVILAAFLWKRVTPAGGVASVAAGLITWAVFVGLILTGVLEMDFDYIIYPAAGASIFFLVAVSLVTRPSPPEVYRQFVGGAEEAGSSEGS